MAISTGVLCLVGMLVIPVTYAPVLQRRRTQQLSKMTGKVYKSRGDVDRGQPTFRQVFRTSLLRRSNSTEPVLRPIQTSLGKSPKTFTDIRTCSAGSDTNRQDMLQAWMCRFGITVLQ